MFKRHLLAIESSCDECAAAVLSPTGEVLSDVVRSQVQPHVPYGGVVPEVASRVHLTDIAWVVQKALTTAEVKPADIGAVGVTYGPGLVGSLLVGVQFAKGFAEALQVPCIGVHHIEAHLLAGLGEDNFPHPPFMALVVSGGHTALYTCGADFEMRLLSETRDDAAGEAFDKIAKMLNLGYPGGHVIDKLAVSGNADRFVLPIALRHKKTLDFSYSGLKTSVRNLIFHLRKEHGEIGDGLLHDLCASVQKAIVVSLVEKTMIACKQLQMTQLVLGGGVVANSRLRADMHSACLANKIRLFSPDQKHCTDNAVMVAKAARRRLNAGVAHARLFDVMPNAPLSIG